MERRDSRIQRTEGARQFQVEVEGVRLLHAGMEGDLYRRFQVKMKRVRPLQAGMEGARELLD